MNRRDFIKAAIVGAAGVSVPLRAEKAQPQSDHQPMYFYNGSLYVIGEQTIEVVIEGPHRFTENGLEFL